MPSRVNLHESGLPRSPRLQEKAEWRHEKAHVTWASKLTPERDSLHSLLFSQ